MGFFSTDCKGCGHPLLNKEVTNETNAWMSKGIAIFRDGEVAKGSYDGYGRLGRFDSEGGLDEATVLHEACHEVLGGSLKFAGHSQSSDDQGYFFDEGAHDFADPRKAEDPKAALAVELAKMQAARKARAEKQKREWELRDEERKIVAQSCPLCGFDTYFPIKLATGEVAIRCPNRDCNKLYAIPEATQAALLAFAERNPDFHTFWDDEQVNPAFAELRSVRDEIKRYYEELEQAKDHKWDDEVAYIESHIGKLKVKLEEEERKALERKTLGLDQTPLTADSIKLLKDFAAGNGRIDKR
jgi:uncharacterized OB-fold protein